MKPRLSAKPTVLCRDLDPQAARDNANGPASNPATRACLRSMHGWFTANLFASFPMAKETPTRHEAPAPELDQPGVASAAAL
jgi:hypothetical protein